jgi:hypothetical protein
MMSVTAWAGDAKLIAAAAAARRKNLGADFTGKTNPIKCYAASPRALIRRGIGSDNRKRWPRKNMAAKYIDVSAAPQNSHLSAGVC